MTSAGRILIMPKGNYDSSVTYEMLDLVFYDGASWVAKKTTVGITPSDASIEHWMKMCDSVDLTDVYNKITSLENNVAWLGSSISPTSVRLLSYKGNGTCGYDNPCSVYCENFAPRVIIYLGYDMHNPNGDPLYIMQHSPSAYGKTWTESAIFCDYLTTEYQSNIGFKEASNDDNNLNYSKKSDDGKTVYWYINGDSATAKAQLNDEHSTYYFLAIS